NLVCYTVPLEDPVELDVALLHTHNLGNLSYPPYGASLRPVHPVLHYNEVQGRYHYPRHIHRRVYETGYGLPRRVGVERSESTVPCVKGCEEGYGFTAPDLTDNHPVGPLTEGALNQAVHVKFTLHLKSG